MTKVCLRTQAADFAKRPAHCPLRKASGTLRKASGTLVRVSRVNRLRAHPCGGGTGLMLSPLPVPRNDVCTVVIYKLEVEQRHKKHNALATPCAYLRSTLTLACWVQSFNPRNGPHSDNEPTSNTPSEPSVMDGRADGRTRKGGRRTQHRERTDTQRGPAHTA